MKLGLDSTTFKWFNFAVEIEEKYPSDKPREFYSALYPKMIESILTSRLQKTDLEKLVAIKELHEEYQQIMVALEQLERGEEHETTPIDATGKTYSEAPSGYRQDATVAM